MKLALEVEKVKEIVDVEDSRVLPMPTLMSGQQCCFNDVACQKELIVMLDVKSLLSQEEQAAIRKMISDNTSDK